MNESIRGQFLIAGRSLRDPNFFKTVVLIVEHNDEGAMGLVINRPSEVTVARALEGHFEVGDTEEVVYIGGPVERNALFILHDSEADGGLETPVIPGLFIGNSADTFEEVVQRHTSGAATIQFRVFSGCAGWGPEQLDGELARNDWHVLPATLEYVFHEQVYHIWELVLGEYRRQHPLAPGQDINPDMN